MSSNELSLDEFETLLYRERSEAWLQERIRRACRELGLPYFHDSDARRNYAGFPDV